MNAALSGLAFIEVQNPNPFHLFTEWRKEAIEYGHLAPSVMNLATCTRDRTVSNRTVLTLKFDTSGFVFLTVHGRKVQEIDENPNVSSTFLWVYKKNEKCISRQVRIEGVLEQIDPTTTEEIYDKAPLFAKIRGHICQQGEPIEWQKLKARHDEFLENVTSGKETLSMPKNILGYKLVPNVMDFYYAYDNFIADRVKFSKTEENTWEYIHVQA